MMVTYYVLLLAGSVIGAYDTREICEKAAAAEVAATAVAHQIKPAEVQQILGNRLRCEPRETR